MHLVPVRQLRIRFNRGVSAEAWPPLIDGTYAIILTLLVIELPILVLDLLRDYNHEEIGVLALLASIGRLLFGYLGVFWSFMISGLKSASFWMFLHQQAWSASLKVRCSCCRYFWLHYCLLSITS